jgi:hypothetical protein
MQTDNFYGDLTAHQGFLALDVESESLPVPEDWHIVITDIRGSTGHIEAGSYKTVNMVGALSIVAILNLDRDIDLPFVFGGDGASMAIPSSLLEKAQGALESVRDIASHEFKMELRIGIVPVKDLYGAGHNLRLAKFTVSEHYQQAVFLGDGLRAAESWLKSDAKDQYMLPHSATAHVADLSGLECRWRDIKSEAGETISLLVQATSSKQDEALKTYQMVISLLAEAYGGDTSYRPLSAETLKLTTNPMDLMAEAKVKTYPAGLISLFRYLTSIWFHNVYALITKRPEAKMDFSLDEYTSLLLETSDYRKFDDTLRMVISSTPEQREMLTERLEAVRQQGLLCYGLHISDRAHMTCLVFKRDGRQVHFVDGADGGYAFAAKQLKAQLKERMAK